MLRIIKWCVLLYVLFIDFPIGLLWIHGTELAPGCHI